MALYESTPSMGGGITLSDIFMQNDDGSSKSNVILGTNINCGQKYSTLKFTLGGNGSRSFLRVFKDGTLTNEYYSPALQEYTINVSNVTTCNIFYRGGFTAQYQTLTITNISLS